MRKFILRAKVRIEDAADPGRSGQSRRNAGSGSRYVEHDGVGIAPVGHDASRYWVIGPPEKIAAPADAAAANRIEA